MRDEIASAVSYVLEELCNADAFGSESTRTAFRDALTSELQQRYNNHWFPRQPHRGCAYRRLERSPRGWDAVFDTAAEQAGVSAKALMASCPAHFTIWVDPGEVCARVGSNVRTETLVHIHGSASSSGRESPIMVGTLSSSLSANAPSPPYSPSSSPPMTSSSMSPPSYLIDHAQVSLYGSPMHLLSTGSVPTTTATASATNTPPRIASHAFHPQQHHSQHGAQLLFSDELPVTSTTASHTVSAPINALGQRHQHSAYGQRHYQQQQQQHAMAYSGQSSRAGQFPYYA